MKSETSYQQVQIGWFDSSVSKSTPFLTSPYCKTVEDHLGDMGRYPGTFFFKYRDFSLLLWKGIVAYAARLFWLTLEPK